MIRRLFHRSAWSTKSAGSGQKEPDNRVTVFRSLGTGLPIASRFGIVIALLALFTIVSIPFLSGIGAAYVDDYYRVEVCERTETVRDALVEASPASECGEVTSLHLRDITELDLSDQGIASLSVGDFGGLHRLDALDLSGNSLTTLPAGLFNELFLLTELRLDNNQLTTLPATIFDTLFLLEELTLHDNTMDALPDGMFGDLSRFKGLLDGEEVEGIARIRQFLAEHEVETVEQFIEALPELHKERFVFVYDSAGLGAEFVSTEHPRVISWGADAEFVFAWQTNPDASDKFRSSVEFLLPGETRWTAGLIDFSGDSLEIRQPEACQSCHGELGKPLWSGLFWESAEGGVSDSRSRSETEEAMRGLLASTNPRIVPLDLEGSDFTMGLGNRLFKGYSGMAMYLWPAEQLSIFLSLRHAEMLLERLKQQDDYAALAERAVCAPNPDDAASVVTAPFRESREHTLGLLPYSSTLALSGATEGGNFEYNFNSGTMDGNLLFLLLNDMWETHPEVRRAYRNTDNDDAVRSNRKIDWYLFYPAGQATVEDELIQLRRLYFGHGNRESIRALDTANYAFGEDAGGRNGARTEQFTVAFSEAQVNAMLPKVCQAIKKSRLGGANLGDGLEVAGETSFTVPEGQTGVAALRATHEGRSAADLMWWTAGGADESMFIIDLSGALSFAEPRNFEAPYDADGDGVFEVRVEVSDGERGGSAELTVRLSNVNERPTANAGSDQRNVEGGALVTLSGSGTDPDSGDVLSYAWTQTSGNTVTLSDPAASSPTFTAPADLTADATLVFRLRVTDGGGLYAEDSVRVTVRATVKQQLFSATLINVPESHDGSAAFSFELRFNESPRGLSYRTLEDDAFVVTGGEVTKARRLKRGNDLRWEITVRPDGNDDVTVALPATTNCGFAGAICDAGGRMLAEMAETVIPGPSGQQQNSPATGAPAITGAAQVGEVLTVDTSGIGDSDGLTNVSYTYQWLADDVDISNATGSSYTLVDADEDKTITVRVSFTDDAGNPEVLTSASTAAVAAAPEQSTPFTATIHNADTSHDGSSSVFTFELRLSESPKRPFSYRLLRDDAFTVTGGAVTKARRLDRKSETPNIRWEISVRPDGNGAVTIVLPATTDCEAEGAICAADGRMLSSRLDITVPGPGG